MRKKNLLALFVIASFLTSFIGTKASAETAFQAAKFPFKEMQVQVMPEFDYPENWGSRDIPSLLIGQYGTITNNSGQDYDGKIEIPIPAKEKGFQLILVAEFPEENKPEVQRPYDIDKDKGVVSWKPKSPIKNNATYKYVIEYYTQSIDVKDKKSFTYELNNNAAIEKLDVVFYAPMNAKNVQLEPKAQQNGKNEYEEELYYYQYNKVKSGENLKYTFSYQKDGTESSLEAINKKESAKQNGNKTATDQIKKNGNKSLNQPLIGVGGASIIGIAIIIAGVFVYLGLKGNSRSASRPTKGQKYPKQQQKKPTASKESKLGNTDEKKELRKKLLTGKIDQETYEEEMKKLI